MADMPMPPQGAPAPEAAPQDPQQGKGASQLVADTHSNMMKLLDLVQSKFPDDGQALAGIIQQFQGFVDGLGSGPGQAPKGPARPATTTPEAGAAKVSPVL